MGEVGVVRKMWVCLLILIWSLCQHASARSTEQPETVESSTGKELRWLLYEVRQDQRRVAYLFGSAHNPIGETKIPKKIFDALERSRRVEFEWNFFDPQQSAESGRLLTTNHDGKPLTDLLLPHTLRTLQELYDFNRIPAEGQATINTWTPFMAVLTMSLPCTRVAAAGAAPEQVIYEYAKLAKLSIGDGLENAQEQLGRLSLLSGEQWDRYVQAHVAWIKDPHCNEQFAANTRKIWSDLLRGDADAVVDEYMRFYSEIVPIAWFQNDYFLMVRNGPMVEKMTRLFHLEQPVFISVGAAHLGGSAGIVSLLRQRGYQVVQQ